MKFIDMTENVAVVTGASRGIGLESAKLLLQAGSRVVLNSRAETEAANSVYATLEASYPGQTSVVFGSVAVAFGSVAVAFAPVAVAFAPVAPLDAPDHDANRAPPETHGPVPLAHASLASTHERR